MTTYKEIELKMIFKESFTVTIDVQVSADKCEQYTYDNFEEAKAAIENFEQLTTVYF